MSNQTPEGFFREDGLECTDQRCPVCKRYLHDHWRGRPCMDIDSADGLPRRDRSEG